MVRLRAVPRVVLWPVLMVGCTGGEEDRLPRVEDYGSGTGGQSLARGGAWGQGGEPGLGGLRGGGGEGTGGISSETTLHGNLFTTNGFLFRLAGQLFDFSAPAISFDVRADGMGNETVTQRTEAGGGDVEMPGVLESPTTWVLVSSQDEDWYSTWQAVDLTDSSSETLFALTGSDMVGVATDIGATLDPEAAQIILRVQDSRGVARAASAQATGVGDIAYSQTPRFDATGPSDQFGFVVLLNVPAVAEPGEIDLTVTPASGEVIRVPVRVEAGAVTVIRATVPE
ncbi:MAG: hypothetical protein JW751_01370 [Polyangiaceae bacterium]|nr:hypothetical protein [Polyangiaceae bacterium]